MNFQNKHRNIVLNFKRINSFLTFNAFCVPLMEQQPLLLDGKPMKAVLCMLKTNVHDHSIFRIKLDELKTLNKKYHPLLIKAEEEGIKSQIEEMQSDINEFESLRHSKKPPVIDISTIKELPLNLIRARIALNLTQKVLAELVGVKEQQIQRWEANEYSTTSISRILEVIKALHIAMRK